MTSSKKMELQNFTIKKNIYKEKDNHPNYIMSANIDGQWKDIGACWAKTDKKGNPYMSCSISKPKPSEEKVAEVLPGDMPF